jgi:hypothetical protein
LNPRRDFRVVEVVVSEIQPSEMNKVEEAAIRIDGAIKTAATEVKADHMARVPIALYSLKQAPRGIAKLKHTLSKKDLRGVAVNTPYS